MKTPTTFIDETVAIEPRCDSSGSTWIQPNLTKSVDGFIRIPNLTSSPVAITKHQHLVQAYLTTTPDELDISPNKYENTLFIKSVHSNSPHCTHSSEAHSLLIIDRRGSSVHIVIGVVAVFFFSAATIDTRYSKI